MPGANNATYEKKRKKQISIHRKYEKWAFTAVFFSSQTGKILPIQSIWKRTISKSPFINQASAEAKTIRHCFMFNQEIY